MTMGTRRRKPCRVEQQYVQQNRMSPVINSCDNNDARRMYFLLTVELSAEYSEPTHRQTDRQTEKWRDRRKRDAKRASSNLISRKTITIYNVSYL